MAARGCFAGKGHVMKALLERRSCEAVLARIVLGTTLIRVFLRISR